MSYGRRTYEYSPDQFHTTCKDTQFSSPYNSIAPPSVASLKLPQLPPINEPSVHRLVFTKPKDSGLPNIGSAVDNATLSWLGDDYLNMIVADYIYDKFEKKNTADLITLRTIILSNENIVKWCEYYHLPHFMQSISQVQLNRFIDQKTYVHLFKAYLAGVIKTNDLKTGYDWIAGIVAPSIKDYEAELQNSDGASSANEEVRTAKEELYKIINPTFKPIYEVLEMTTPPDVPYFNIACVIQNKILGTGYGQNKKIAGSKAAYNVLKATRIKFDKNSSQLAVEQIADFMTHCADFKRKDHPKVVKYDYFSQFTKDKSFEMNSSESQ
ncbi:hypothetical protein WICPIJ_003207 [Wickerhamomyces pijperi]|uniref:RNase III domain-containing protein n=1 Tax=Wickerhamomyces pijperi TaxID=599730 RepID=A0A9P8TP34_WICPI|nr:hypothetical protein WICPIJ_003207 [Wickerhamomyces pijperi]